MDPATALGIAGNVFQFVDFASRLISKGAEYYQSADGALLEQTELGAAAENLAILSKALKEPVFKSTIFEDPTPPSAHRVIEKGLWEANEQCHQLALELSDVLNNLKVSGKHRGWKSFRQALKSLWSEDKINILSTRLSQAREQLVVHLLVNLSIRNSIGNQLVIFDSTAFQQNILSAIEKSWIGLRQDVEKLTETLSGLNVKQERALLSQWQYQNRAQLSVVSQHLQEVVEGAQFVTTQDKFLDSLYFTRIEERRQRIPEAHKETFKWTLGGVREDGTRWDDFKCWLQDSSARSNFFWISGKAGSGKSTLMRYLDDSDETKVHLQRWAGRNKLLIARCFFWRAGTKMQKSYTGLMRTLLHRLLSLDRSLIEIIDPWRWRALDLGARQLDEWTDTELKLGFDKLVRKTRQTSRIVIFVDGLDEFDGTEDQLQSLIDVLLAASNYTHVKICVSSRPWNIFQDAFAQCATLRLEMLTHSDIKIYIQDTLESNLVFQKQSVIDSASCASLVTEVTRKASGVFLWVVLVVRELLKGLRHGQDMRLLRKHVDSIPSDLNSFFLSMIQSIDESNRATASKILQVVINAPMPVTLMDLSFCDEERIDFAVDDIFRRHPTLIDISTRNELMSRRLNTLCMGLLEIKDITSFKTAQEQEQLASFANYRYEVDYLHRTVHDFLLTRESSQTLQIYTCGPFDTTRYLCNALAAQIVLLGAIPETVNAPDFVLGPSNRQHLFSRFLDSFMSLLQQLELSTQTSPISLIEKTKAVILRLVSEVKGTSNLFYDTMASQAISNWDEWQCTFLTLAVQYNLELYVEHALQTKSMQWRDTGRPLLDVALWRFDRGSCMQNTPCPGMIRLLLSYGANPNASSGTSTIYDRFIEEFPYDLLSHGGLDDGSILAWSKTSEMLTESMPPRPTKNVSVNPTKSPFKARVVSRLRLRRILG